MNPTGFMSEHTAEYALVSNIIVQLADRYPRIIPMYFWSTREGTHAAEESMRLSRVRIIAAFARRPKVFSSDKSSILVKINSQLLVSATLGSNSGIPVLAGVPLVTSLFDYSIETPCNWFNILPNSPNKENFEFCIPIGNQALMPSLSPYISGPLERSQIIDIIDSGSQVVSWMEAVEGMRTIQRAGTQYALPWFAGLYRPFFLVLPV